MYSLIFDICSSMIFMLQPIFFWFSLFPIDDLNTTLCKVGEALKVICVSHLLDARGVIWRTYRTYYFFDISWHPLFKSILSMKRELRMAQQFEISNAESFVLFLK